jgi:hypothetical protein
MLTPTITLVIQNYVSDPGVRAKPGVRVDGDSQVEAELYVMMIVIGIYSQLALHILSRVFPVDSESYSHAWVTSQCTPDSREMFFLTILL